MTDVVVVYVDKQEQKTDQFSLSTDEVINIVIQRYHQSSRMVSIKDFFFFFKSDVNLYLMCFFLYIVLGVQQNVSSLFCLLHGERTKWISRQGTRFAQLSFVYQVSYLSSHFRSLYTCEQA